MTNNGPIQVRQFANDTFNVTYEEFVVNIVQDDETAYIISADMLTANMVYKSEPDEPQFYEEYEVINADILRSERDAWMDSQE